VNDVDYLGYFPADDFPTEADPYPGYADYPRWNPPPHSRLARGHPPRTGPMPAYRPEYPPEYPPRYRSQTGGPAPRYPPSDDWDGGYRARSRPQGAELLRSLLEDGDDAPPQHRDASGGWLRPAVFGAMDGLVTNSSLIAGIGGGGGGHGMIVLTAGKLRRLTEIFVEKGVSPNLPERAVATHVREELGIDPDDLPSPETAAAASFAAFTVGALIPLGPFLLGFSSLSAALVAAGLAAAAGGAAVARLTGRSMLAGGLRQFAAAFLATGMAFGVGHLISGVVA
jgi:VIT1/CCC1 family predicted Fe2+/Mn2+ transporter